MKVDGITYPDELDAMLADKLLGPAFRAYAKKNLISEIVDFMDAQKPPRDYKKLYDRFIDLKGKDALNIPSGIRKACDKLAKEDNWDKSRWKSYIDASVVHVDGQAQTDHFVRFSKTEHFLPFHRANLRRKFKKVSKAQLDEWGIAKKHEGDLMDMAALLVADKKAGEKAAGVMVSKKRTSVKEKKDFIKKVKKFFKIK